MSSNYTAIWAMRVKASLGDLAGEGRRTLDVGRRWFWSRWKSYRTEADKEVKAAIESIQQTEDLYKEQMRIKAPAAYWAEKGEIHKENSKNYRQLLLKYVKKGGGSLLISLFILVLISIFSDGTARIFIGALGIVLTTVAFWAGRILVRLYLSEHHLAIDADERAIMAKTYLALTAERQAEEADRLVVLNALFRPTADGIIRDEAAPDISLPSFLSRIVDRMK